MIGHVGIDPDSEIVTATQASLGNAGDASVAEDLIADLLDQPATESDIDAAAPAGEADGGSSGERAVLYGDNGYGTQEFHGRLAEARIESWSALPEGPHLSASTVATAFGAPEPWESHAGGCASERTHDRPSPRCSCEPG